MNCNECPDRHNITCSRTGNPIEHLFRDRPSWCPDINQEAEYQAQIDELADRLTKLESFVGFLETKINEVW